MQYKKGAPKGGRVHLLPLLTTKYFKTLYKCEYFYNTKSYYFQRKFKKDFDSYSIIQTSSHCWRCIYFDRLTKFSEYESFKTLSELLDYINYRLVKRLVNEEIYKNKILRSKKK